MSIYIPPNCNTLDTLSSPPQVRLGIQGFPGSGKTFASLSFKNPIVINLDRGLGAHEGRKDVIEIPFYKQSFSGQPHEAKDKLIQWLDKESKNITEEQTLVVDSCSAIEVAYHSWFEKNKLNVALGGSGKVNDFVEWQLKERYFGEIFATFKTLRCDVIWITHESERRDKSTTIGIPGEYTGKIRPLMTGKVADTMNKDFTDWFRQMSAEKPKDLNAVSDEVLKNWGMNKAEFKDMANSFPRDTIYFWQTSGDNTFDAKAGSMVNFPKFIPANYSSFQKYRRKQITKEI